MAGNDCAPSVIDLLGLASGCLTYKTIRMGLSSFVGARRVMSGILTTKLGDDLLNCVLVGALLPPVLGFILQEREWMGHGYMGRG